MWHLPWHAGDSEGEGQNGQEDHAKTEQDLTTEEPWQPWSDNTRDRGVNSRNFAIFYDPVMTLFYDPSTSINPLVAIIYLLFGMVGESVQKWFVSTSKKFLGKWLEQNEDVW